MRSSDGKEGIDTYIRQSIGKEPFLSFSRTGDASVQWFQLLNALDQQGTVDFLFWFIVKQMEANITVHLLKDSLA